MINLNEQQRSQFHDILNEVGKNLDISETEYNTAVSSYHAVGRQLSKENSLLYPYSPEILPQGSFLTGTMIKPVNETDDLDIDLVCQLRGKHEKWTQEILKLKIGEQLCKNEIYKQLLETPDGRRCWTLKYREGATDDTKKYHMDILPSVVEFHYRMILENSFSAIGKVDNIDELAIRITDKEKEDYSTEVNHHNWLKSNPFGYAKWFENRAIVDNVRESSLSGTIQEVPQFQKEKLPLQRVIQILKRHRDMMFSKADDKEDKPISIIITTLSAKAYTKEKNILVALEKVINDMPNFIEEKYDYESNKKIKWISNPVNDEENFADKWVEHPKRQINFYKWLEEVKKDVVRIKNQRGANLILEMKKSFGDKAIEKSFNNIGNLMKTQRNDNLLKMSPTTGMLGNEGVLVRKHNFYGKKD